MNLSLEQVLLAAGQVAVVSAMWARLETAFGSHARQANARLTEVEKRTGVKNGGPTPFMERHECEDKEKRSNARLLGVEEKVEDHEHRLTIIETRLPQPQ